MVYRLHLVRHGQATHSPNHDITIPDPPLTEMSTQQSIKLNEDFPYHRNVGLMITSPLRRTLQTAIIGFSTCLNGGTARLSLEPEIQAHSSRPCDTCSTVECLQIEFPDLPWSELDLGGIYPAKEGIYATDVESLEKRGRRAQGLLLREFKRLEGTGREDIVVASHGGFLGHISGHHNTWKYFSNILCYLH